MAVYLFNETGEWDGRASLYVVGASSWYHCTRGYHFQPHQMGRQAIPRWHLGREEDCINDSFWMNLLSIKTKQNRNVCVSIILLSAVYSARLYSHVPDTRTCLRRPAARTWWPASTRCCPLGGARRTSPPLCRWVCPRWGCASLAAAPTTPEGQRCVSAAYTNEKQNTNEVI